jgi:prophage regulatory protein
LKISKGEFPKPVPLGSRAVAWKSADIDAWIAAQEQAGKPKQVAASR